MSHTDDPSQSLHDWETMEHICLPIKNMICSKILLYNGSKT